MKKFVKKYFHLTFFIFISLIANFYLLITRGIPFRYDWNWPVFNPNSVWQFLSASGSGIFDVLTKNTSVLFAVLGTLSLNTEVFLRVFLFLITFISAYGAYVFISKQKITESLRLIFVTIYALSPYIFIRTIVGYRWSSVAYALLPIVLHLYLNKQKKLYHYILLGFLISLLSAQIQAGILLLLMFFVHLVISLFNKSQRLNQLKSFVLTYLFFVVFTLPWYIYSIINKVDVAVVNGNAATTMGYMSLVPHSLRNMLMLSDHQITSSFFYALSHNKFILLGWIVIWLVSLAAIFNKNNRTLVCTLIISSILVLPFVKGPTGAIGKFYIWFYNHVPQIAVFRETYHFEFLYTITICTLFIFGLDWLWLKIGQMWTKHKSTTSVSAVKIAVKTVLAGSALFIIMPFFTFDYAGYLHLQVIPPEYSQLNDFLQSNKNYCQKIYYPPGLGFIYFKGDNAPDASNNDIIAYSLQVPYLDDGTTFSYLPSDEKFYRNELASQFYELNDDGEFSYLLKQGGIDCVISRLDIDTKYWLASNLGKESDSSVNSKWRNTDYRALIESKKGLRLDKQFGDNIYIYKPGQNGQNDQISDTLYKEKVDASVGQSSIKQFTNKNILQFPLTQWATAVAYYKDGWSRGRYDFWRKHLFTELRQDFIYTDLSSSQINGKVSGGGSCSLVARYLDGGRPGSFEINLDSNKITVNKNSGGVEKFIWKDLGHFDFSSGDVSIKNISGENAIADLDCLY